MRPLAGQIAWIVGGGSGVGAATAATLAEAGATVILSGRRQEALDAAAAGLAGARTVPLDVTIGEAVEAAANGILDREGRIDLLVNSAGINIVRRTWTELSAADWDRVIATNATGAFHAARAVLPAMRAQGGGLIVNIASWGGRFPIRFAGAAYTASKSALVALTQTLNMEEATHGIRACAILPAAIASDMLKQRADAFDPAEIARMLPPAEVARVVRFVAETSHAVVLNEILLSPLDNLVYRQAA